MLLRRRIVLLVSGLCGSGVFALLLVCSCMGVLTVPVVAQVSVGFPWNLENSPLVIQGITGYEGAYVEDGTDDEVVDVAALILYNSGQGMINEARVQLECDGETLSFYVTKLPAESALVVLEENRQMWNGQSVYACSADIQWETELVKEKLGVQEEEMGVLRLTNPTEAPVSGITLYHKTWSEELNMYLGGITYKTQVDQVSPGQMLLLQPEHYACGKSRIVGIGYNCNFES